MLKFIKTLFISLIIKFTPILINKVQSACCVKVYYLFVLNTQVQVYVILTKSRVCSRQVQICSLGVKLKAVPLFFLTFCLVSSILLRAARDRFYQSILVLFSHQCGRENLADLSIKNVNFDKTVFKMLPQLIKSTPGIG